MNIEIDEAELIRRAKGGELKAFDLLWSRYTALVAATVAKNLRSLSDADDAVQETAIKVWNSINKYDPAQGTFATWICTIAKRRSVDSVRRGVIQEKRKEKITEEFNADACTASANDEPDLLPFIEEAAKREFGFEAPAILRTLELAGEGKSREAISEETRVPVYTVNQRLDRGRKALQKALTLEGIAA